jgi:ArsR family transcriptional regulator
LAVVDVSTVANLSTFVNVRVQEDAVATKPIATIGAPECCASLLTQPLTDADAETLATGFAALADPVRLKLINLIAQAGTICSCDLTGPVGRSQPTVSHHTRILTDAGLIVGEKKGRWVWWQVVPDRVEALQGALAGSPPAT